MTDKLERLKAAGARYAKAEAARQAALDVVATAMRDLRADDPNFPITTLADLGHVSRPTVYRLLKDDA